MYSVTTKTELEEILEFTHFYEHFTFDNPLKNTEMQVEDDYNTIDGIINNGSKKDMEEDIKKEQKSVRAKIKENKEKLTLSNYRAKEAFKKFEGQKLPKVKELSEEYAKILQEKRKLYESYKETRKEMMDYQIAKQDIDRFLEIDEKQKNAEKKKEIQL